MNYDFQNPYKARFDSRYTVARCRNSWAIVRKSTGRVILGGIQTKKEAESYLLT
jgi:hypothetical protein